MGFQGKPYPLSLSLKLKQKRQLGGQTEALGVHGAESGNLRLVRLETGSCYAALMARIRYYTRLAWGFSKCRHSELPLPCQAGSGVPREEKLGLRSTEFGGCKGGLEPTKVSGWAYCLLLTGKEGIGGLQKQRLLFWACEGVWGRL